jgi:hypothetical protein
VLSQLKGLLKPIILRLREAHPHFPQRPHLPPSLLTTPLFTLAQ